MASVRIVVTLDVNLKEMGAEYGLDDFKLKDAREYITNDMREFLVSTPYAHALENVEVK